MNDYLGVVAQSTLMSLISMSETNKAQRQKGLRSLTDEQWIERKKVIESHNVKVVEVNLLNEKIAKAGKMGRNEICHCGSGVKVKRCCLKINVNHLYNGMYDDKKWLDEQIGVN